MYIPCSVLLELPSTEFRLSLGHFGIETDSWTSRTIPQRNNLNYTFSSRLGAFTCSSASGMCFFSSPRSLSETLNRHHSSPENHLAASDAQPLLCCVSPLASQCPLLTPPRTLVAISGLKSGICLLISTMCIIHVFVCEFSFSFDLITEFKRFCTERLSPLNPYLRALGTPHGFLHTPEFPT